jgi:hypothetical protein
MMTVVCDYQSSLVVHLSDRFFRSSRSVPLRLSVNMLITSGSDCAIFALAGKLPANAAPVSQPMTLNFGERWRGFGA